MGVELRVLSDESVAVGRAEEGRVLRVNGGSWTTCTVS